MTAHLHLWLRALLTVALLLASPRAFAHADLFGSASAKDLASALPSGPPRPGAARRKAGPWRAELASTPGRDAPAPRRGSTTELDAIGNVRHLHAGLDPSNPNFTGDLGGYSYSAFGKTLSSSDPGGVTPPGSITQPFQWQGKRLIAPNLYDSRARVWSADLGAFLQPDEYGFLTRGGTLWSWPGQNAYRWRDPSGRDAALPDWFYANTSWIDEVAPALAAAGVQSDIAPLMAVGEASLLAMNAIDAVASLDAQRQSGAAIAKATSNDENECKDPHATAPTLGDLTPEEIKQIQGVVDAAGRPLDVVGSAARGTRTASSDIDYTTAGANHQEFDGLADSLPGLDPGHGLLKGGPDRDMGPSVRFEPGNDPRYVPGAP